MRATVYLNVLRQRRERSLHVEHVTKIYPGGGRALDDVSLSFASGLCGILGPEGAGKSTLLRILAMQDTPDRGNVRYDGIDGRQHPERFRAALNAVERDPPVPASVPVVVALEHFASSVGWVERRMRIAWVEAKLRQVGLWETRGLRVGELSDIMRWRFSLARTLINSPTALLLDEPTRALAPDATDALLSLLRELAEHRLVIVATRDARTLRDVATQVAVLHRGMVLREGDVDRLIDELAGRVWAGTPSPAEMQRIAGRHVVLTPVPAGDAAATVHVVADTSPGPTFVAVEPDLVHVYRYSMASAAA